VTGADRTARQVGNALRRVRERRRWRQYQLAAAAGVTLPQLAAYERGSEQPGVASLAALLVALGCSVEEYGRHVGPWGHPPRPPRLKTVSFSVRATQTQAARWARVARLSIGDLLRQAAKH
jgi:transcriptional regulator with XRE-family HTH domain